MMKTQMKKKMIVGIIIVLILLIATVAVVVTVNSDSRKLPRLLELGQRYLDEMDYEQAVATFTEAIEIDPNCWEAYMGRGDAYNGLGGEENMALALDDYNIAMELDDTNAKVYLNIAEIYVAQDRRDAACDILLQGLEKAENTRKIQAMLDEITEQEAEAEEIQQPEDSSDSEDLNENEESEENSEENTEENTEETTEETVEEIENAIYVSTGEELKSWLEKGEGLSDCTIVLEGKDYNLNSECYMSGAQNVTILGTEGTRILCNNGYDLILSIGECRGIVLKNLVLGHDIPSTDYCDVGVLGIYESEVSLINCDIFGCGVEGFYASYSSLIFDNTIVRDCSSAIMEGTDITAEFTNCRFSGNGYAEPWSHAISLWTNEAGNMLTFSGCVFENNQNPMLVNEEEAGSLRLDNCTFAGNAWD